MMKSQAKCRLILDSCCDLPRDLIEEAGIEFLQFPFNMNDGEHLDDLGRTMSAKEFYGRLRKGEVSGTAQIPVPILTEAFERAAKDGTPTVYLGFSSGLSGTFETAQRIVEDIRTVYPDFEIHLVDTKLASIAEGLLVNEAICQRDRGLSAAQLSEWAEEARWYVNCRFTLDDLESLRRGGRIPDMAAYAGSKLDVKPILSFNLDGTLSLKGAARGRKKSLKAMVAEYNELHTTGADSDQIMLVGSADANKDADWVAQHLDRSDSAVPPLRCDIGPVIGAHVGPGMVAVAFWGPDRRETMSIADKIASKFK